MSLIEEYPWQPSESWVLSSILLPLQRGHILSSRATLSHLFQHVGCDNLFWVLRELFSWDFFVLNIGKQKGYNSFWWSDKSLVYASAEASGSSKRNISYTIPIEQYLWTQCQRVVPNDVPRDFGPVIAFRYLSPGSEGGKCRVPRPYIYIFWKYLFWKTPTKIYNRILKYQ